MTTTIAKAVKIKIRFHLGQGENYKKWQIKDGDRVTYITPEDHVLILENCKLNNRAATAQKIYGGENKTVCAWIECDKAMIFRADEITNKSLREEVSYNPRIAPHWIFQGSNADGMTFPSLISEGSKLFTN